MVLAHLKFISDNQRCHHQMVLIGYCYCHPWLPHESCVLFNFTFESLKVVNLDFKTFNRKL